MKLALYISILLICFSCKKSPLLGNRKILVGTWNWQSSRVLDNCQGWFVLSNHSPTTVETNYKVVFLKRGIIEFYQNETLLSKHKIKFKELYIQKEGIVESHKEISFLAILDGDPKKILRAKGTPNEFQISDFPYSDEEDCVAYAFNTFRKE